MKFIIIIFFHLIVRISYTGGGTRTDIALQMANSGLFSSSGGDRGDKRNVLVVITDGKTNRGSKPYSSVLAPLIVSTSPSSILCSYFVAFFSVTSERPMISSLSSYCARPLSLRENDGSHLGQTKE